MSKNQFMLQQCLAALQSEICLTPSEHARREEALDLLPDILESGEEYRIDGNTLTQLFSAYFLCTYAVGERLRPGRNKHSIKNAICNVARSTAKDALKDGGTTEGIATIPHRAKPLALVVVNHFTSNHVMYKCFAKSITAMREKFNTVALCVNTIDQNSADCFDRVIFAQIPAAPHEEIVRNLVKTIRQVNPDLIVYADIAMHPFSIMLATLRLAPLQVILSGHPAPSGSKQLDSMLWDEGFKGCDFSEFTEGVTFTRSPLAMMPPPRQLQMQRFKYRDSTKIIVPVAVQKLTYPFLLLLRDIQLTCDEPAEFHICTNLINTAHITGLIHLTLPDAIVHPALSLPAFHQLIAEMDMFLMTYPFAGFNTVIDCLIQGVPGIVMDHPRVETRQAVIAMRELMPQGHMLLVRSRDEYLAKAVQLAGSHELLAMFRSKLRGDFLAGKHLDLPMFAPTSPGIADALDDLHLRLDRGMEGVL